MDIELIKKELLENEGERERTKHLVHEKLLYLSDGMEDSGWEFVIEERGVTVSRTLSILENVRGTKGVCLLPSNPETIVSLISDIRNWKRWDPQRVAESQVIGEYGDTKINYIQYHSIFPVSSRDVCFLSSVIKHPDDGGYSVIWNSVSSTICPKKSGIVRALFYPSGFVVKPLQELNSCLVTFVLQYDLQGWVPATIQNGITAQLPLVLCAIDQTLRGQDICERPGSFDSHSASTDDGISLSASMREEDFGTRKKKEKTFTKSPSFVKDDTVQHDPNYFSPRSLFSKTKQQTTTGTEDVSKKDKEKEKDPREKGRGTWRRKKNTDANKGPSPLDASVPISSSSPLASAPVLSHTLSPDSSTTSTTSTPFLSTPSTPHNSPSPSSPSLVSADVQSTTPPESSSSDPSPISTTTPTNANVDGEIESSRTENPPTTSP